MNQVPTETQIPNVLTAYRTWVCWRKETRRDPKDGKETKIPYQTNGRKAEVNAPSTWTTFARARTIAIEKQFDGIGFVLQAHMGLIAIDLDHCTDNSGKIETWAAEILAQFPQSYAEWSPSGEGIHLWIKGVLPEGRRRVKMGHRSQQANAGVEIYSEGRYLTVTGRALKDRSCEVSEGGDVLEAFYAEVFAQQPEPELRAKNASPSSSLSTGYQELLETMFAARNGAEIEALWNGDTSAYGGDHSAADLALVGHLAFYCGPDGQDQVDALFRQSGLMREKWEKKHRSDGRTYGEMTIDRVYANQREFWESSDFVALPTPKGRSVNKNDLSTQPVMTDKNGSDEIENDPKTRPVNVSTDSIDKTIKWGTVGEISPHAPKPFPVNELPPILRDYALNAADFLKVPIDMPVMVSLAALSFCTCRRWDVEITPGYIETTNLYIAITAEPGSRKSSTLEAMMFPVRVEEMHLADDVKERMSELQERREAQQATLEQKRKERNKCEDPVRRETIEQEIAGLKDSLVNIPAEPRLLVEDVTSERLVGILKEQQGTVAVISSEGGILQTIGGRYSDGIGNFDVYLKGHDGESYRVDRLNREAEYIPAVRLSICLMVQPNVLQSLAQKKEFRGRGFLGRFLFSMPADLRGTRMMDEFSTGYDQEIRNLYSRALRTLLRYPDVNNDKGDKYLIALSPEARKFHVDRANHIEGLQGPKGDLREYADWASKLAGRVARIAAGFHALEHREDRPEDVMVSLDNIARAWIIAEEYLIDHALRAFGVITQTELGRQAEIVLEWIRRKEVRQFKSRDCQRDLQRHIKDAKELELALQLLEVNNVVKGEEQRRNSKIWHTNPVIFSEA